MRHQEAPEPAMGRADVVDVCSSLLRLEIEVWIDGGWGVDALLRRQTRPHRDLDIAIRQQDVPRLREFLKARGYRDLPRDDARPWNFVLGDHEGREIDVHAFVFDREGNGLHGSPERGVMYPAGSLSGIGEIGGHEVRCISPEWVVKFHRGYDLKEKDYRDVSAICERFGIAPPAEFERFRP